MRCTGNTRGPARLCAAAGRRRPAAAEDVVQETLLRAWKSAGQLDPSDRFGAALAGDGRPTHRHRRPPQPAGPAAGDLPAPLDQFPREDEIDKSLRLMTISDALEDLSAAHREALVETYFRGRTVNEAAEELGMPPGTVGPGCFTRCARCGTRWRREG